MIEVKVEAVLIDSSSNTPVVLLRELDGARVLPVFVGPMEASAIAYVLEGTKFSRPLTLDLMKLLIQGLEGVVQRVIITKLEQETFYAEIVVQQDGRLIAFDARPSDSVGLALRVGAPIYVADEVMDKAGQVIAPEDEGRLRELKAKLRDINPEDFGNYRM
ncbi:MAG: bifunctional nuclease family protein [candidate division WOR-3 bacterium]